MNEVEQGILQIIGKNIGSYELTRFLDMCKNHPVIFKAFWAAGKADFEFDDIGLTPVGLSKGSSNGNSTQDLGVILGDFNAEKAVLFKMLMSGSQDDMKK